jgi:glyoxylase-like metal-dependent hydrolase (beta-lactamase superfamily II)
MSAKLTTAFALTTVGYRSQLPATCERAPRANTAPMADAIPFVTELQFEYGALQPVGPNIRRLVARNPGAFTHVGTGTYVVGTGHVAIIDPGPLLPEHVDSLLHALRGESVEHIVVTHTHIDHSPAAQLVAARTGAKTLGFGPHARGLHEPEDQVEAGADWTFTPTHALRDGDVVEGPGYALRALHTPGHCSNHLCFALEQQQQQQLFTGDHVMGWATTVVVPPDGDMGDYMAQLRRLLSRDDACYWPTHGPAIEQPKPFVSALVRHREAREAQIVACLKQGLSRIDDIVESMYAHVSRSLYPAAARSVFAHLLHLVAQGRVVSDVAASLGGEYRVGE